MTSIRVPRPRTLSYVAAVAALVVLLLLPAALAARFTGPWSPDLLRKPPLVSWGERRGLIQEVYYEGEPYQGHPTRIFAYYGQPAQQSQPVPAMLLVHGGGGKAFADWAEHWAKRGYVALAMDLAGVGPHGRLPDGGPDQSDDTKFRDFSETEGKEMWTYHAVAAVLRGHALLASRPEVDPDRVGVTGISWGGYLTCIVAGVDDRLKVAVPVYGCGFLHDNSVWLEPRFARMSDTQRQRWVNWFDPSRYLPGVNCPILFLNGSNDFAYPLDSYRKSYQLVRAARTLSVQIDLPHGHIWSFREVDAFVDHALRGGPPLAKLTPLKLEAGQASVRFNSPAPVTRATLHYSTDTGPWQKRSWHNVLAQLRGSRATSPLPVARPLVCFMTVTDQRGLTVSTEHVELAD